MSLTVPMFSSYLCLLFCFFFLLTPLTKCSMIGAVSANNDIINQTCKTCADKSTIFSYDFCETSLQAVPVSHATNLEVLAIIAMELAVDDATNTISSIRELLGNGSFDSFALACLEDCLELYSDGVVRMVNAIEAFFNRRYGTVITWMSAVKEGATTCEEGFTEKQGEVSPMTRENYSLFQLCDIALCVINLLSLAVYS